MNINEHIEILMISTIFMINFAFTNFEKFSWTLKLSQMMYGL